MTSAISSREGPAHARISLTTLVAAIAPTVGQKASEAAVAQAARRVGVHGGDCDASQAVEILDALARSGGLLGVAGRFASQKWKARAAQGDLPLRPSLPPPAQPAADPEPPPTPGRLGRAELSAMLAPALGEERSKQVVDATLRALGLGASLDRTETLRVLEKMASEPGIVGVTARFTRARLLLR